MALINAFGALALDQSVMAATPLLKQIHTDLTSTPAVYVVNYPATQTRNVYVTNQTTPLSLVNVNLANPSTPPGIQNVNIVNAATPLLVYHTNTGPIATTLLSTPIVYSYQPFPYAVQGSVSVSNLPGVQNVNVANVATPPPSQNVVLTSTPIVYSYQPFPYSVQGTVSVGNLPGVQNVNVANVSTPPPTQNVNIVNAATPIYTTIFNNATPVNVSVTSTPIVYAVVVNQTSGGAASNVNVTNFPGVQNVNLANPSTPPSVQNVAVTSTPIVYSYQPFPYSVQGTVSVGNFPATQNVQVLNFATPQPVSLVQQTTPIQTFTVVTSTPIVYAYQPFPYSVQGTVSVGNLPATQNVQVLNFATPQPVLFIGQTTPVQVRETATPITYSYQPYPYAITGTLNVGNFPGTQNVLVTNFATPQPVLLYGQTTPIQVAVTSTVLPTTPFVYAYQPFPYAVTVGNFPTGFNVNNFPGVQNVNLANPSTPPVIQNVQVMNFATPQPVSLVQQTTPIQTFTTITSTPTVVAYQGNANYNVAVSNIVATPIVRAMLDPNIQGAGGTLDTSNYFPANLQFDSSNVVQPFKFVNINLNSTAAGFQATPLVLAASQNIRVISYTFTSSAAAIVTLCTTPIRPTFATTASNFQLYAGLPNIVGANAGGPFNVGANGVMTFSGSILGPGLQIGPSTPLYIASNGSNVSGHLTYVFI